MRTIPAEGSNSPFHDFTQDLHKTSRSSSCNDFSLCRKMTTADFFKSVDTTMSRCRKMSGVNYRKPLLQRIRSTVADGLTRTMQFFTFHSQPKSSMCKNYGHRIDKKNWKYGLPKCEDCGVSIETPADLRRSNIR